MPRIEPWSHLLYILSGTGDIIINGSTSGASPPVKYAQARNTRRVILVTIACSFCLSTIRHASERRIKTLAALPGGMGLSTKKGAKVKT